MTTLLSVLLFGFLLSLAPTGNVTPPTTASITVRGNCDMCKRRIETAATVRGVTSASWDAETQLLKLVYDPNTITPRQVEERIAKAGHDTQNVRATVAAYQSLPGCCQYRD